MSPQTLYLMRHGAPVRTGTMLGSTDIAVTAEGIAACRSQAEELRIDHVISSDLQRASACAVAITTDHGIYHTIDTRWREIDFGAWDGLSTGEIDPEALGRFWDDPDRNPPPGGERWSSLVARIAAAIEELPPGDTLVVTHGGAIRAALHGLCGFSQQQSWAFDLPYGVVLALRLWPGSPRTGQILGLWP